MYDGGSDWWREALELLARHPLQPMTYREIDEALDWPRGRFRSVFGGWRSRLGTQSMRPFHLCSAKHSPSGEWVAWMDEHQAVAVRSPESQSVAS